MYWHGWINAVIVLFCWCSYRRELSWSCLRRPPQRSSLFWHLPLVRLPRSSWSFPSDLPWSSPGCLLSLGWWSSWCSSALACRADWQRSFWWNDVSKSPIRPSSQLHHNIQSSWKSSRGISSATVSSRGCPEISPWPTYSHRSSYSHPTCPKPAGTALGYSWTRIKTWRASLPCPLGRCVYSTRRWAGSRWTQSLDLRYRRARAVRFSWSTWAGRFWRRSRRSPWGLSLLNWSWCNLL